MVHCGGSCKLGDDVGSSEYSSGFVPQPLPGKMGMFPGESCIAGFGNCFVKLGRCESLLCLSQLRIDQPGGKWVDLYGIPFTDRGSARSSTDPGCLGQESAGIVCAALLDMGIRVPHAGDEHMAFRGSGLVDRSSGGWLYRRAELDRVVSGSSPVDLLIVEIELSTASVLSLAPSGS